jgi:hypothetical protein
MSNVVPIMPLSVEMSVLEGVRVNEVHANMMWVHMHMMNSVLVAREAAEAFRRRHEANLARIRVIVLALRARIRSRGRGR